ncbi:MAG TPA: CpsD/CapB family tyrosine-protein kinase [Vicinamibacterales bacterium]|nr:CpsD/CapB family tyrosine-protein kinase [Vicinamibacterales bacterium]
MATSQLDPRFVTLTAPATFAAERYQGLRLKLEQLRQRDGKRVIAITSPGAGDGKTLTSINLAGVMARESDARVLLIDADLRRASTSLNLGYTSGTPGLADLLDNDTHQLAKLVQRSEHGAFDVLPAGSSSSPVQQLFRSPRLKTILDDARERYDHILLDTPPLLPVFDAALLARVVDGIIMVVAADRTPRRLLAAALDHLEPSSVVGLVFNNDNSPLLGYHSSAYKPYFATLSSRA